MAQVLPVGPTRLAVRWARPVQNVQAALHLLRARLDHDQGVTLPYCFGVRMHLLSGTPRSRNRRRRPCSPSSVLQVWMPRCSGAGMAAYGSGQGNVWTGKPLLHEVTHDPFRLGQ